MNTEKQVQQFIKTFSTVFLVGLSVAILINFLCDPLQYYRYSPIKKLNTNDRWQVAGFVRNFPYDQVIVGTSMTQNFSLDFIKKTLGTHPIKLSVSGLPIQEQVIVLKAAIHTGKVKSVIWGLDRQYLAYEKGQTQASFPTNLYHQNIWGHLMYLVNINTTLGSIKHLARVWHNQLEPFDLEYYNAWYKDATFSSEIVKKLYVTAKNSSGKIEKELILKSSHEKLKNFYTDMLPIIQKNPKIKFHIFFPPYSLANYKLMHDNDPIEFQEDENLRSAILEKLISLPNVSFYDFETNLEIISNLNNYRDLTHFSQKVNNLIIDALQKKQRIVTQQNLRENINKFSNLPNHSFEE